MNYDIRRGYAGAPENEFGLDIPVRMTQIPRIAKEGDAFVFCGWSSCLD